VIAPVLVASRMVWFATQGICWPVVVLRLPMPYAGAPFSLVKAPPTISRDPSGDSTIARTTPSSARGAQSVSTPFASRAASRVRARPFAEV
jgi:hypothetical protein